MDYTKQCARCAGQNGFHDAACPEIGAMLGQNEAEAQRLAVGGRQILSLKEATQADGRRLLDLCSDNWTEIADHIEETYS